MSKAFFNFFHKNLACTWSNVHIFVILNALNEQLMLPWDAGDKLLFRILQNELGIDMEQKQLVFMMVNLKGFIHLNYDMVFFPASVTIDIGFGPED